jgi:hypothetical protein
MPTGNAKSFMAPNWMNMNAATMRSTLRSCGAQDDHFVARFGAVMVRSSSFRDAGGIGLFLLSMRRTTQGRIDTPADRSCP